MENASGHVVPQTVVFVCTHDAGRSQMAASLFNLLAPRDCGRALSAGVRPAAEVHPQVVRAMGEIGVDMTDARPHPLDDRLLRRADLVVAIGAPHDVPPVSGIARREWRLPDPADHDIARVRLIRDEIRDRVLDLIADLQDSHAPGTG